MQTSQRLSLLFAALTLTLAVLFAWFDPAPTGDTFMTLAGGRDALAGKLGQPDDWAFTTDGRVWVNQSWGTGLLFFGAHQWLGLDGLALVKAVLLGLIALFLVLGARQRGAGWALAMLSAGAALMAAHYAIDIRANLVSLAMLVMLAWLLGAAWRHERWIWLSVPLLVIWANMHGGFLLGIGMLGLWTLAVLVANLFAEIRRPWPTLWPWPAAALVATLAALLLHPFGIDNLIHTLTSLRGEGAIWRNVAEWQPIHWQTQGGFSGPREFFFAVGLLLAILVTAALTAWREGLGTSLKHWLADPKTLFDLGLLTVTVLMTLKAGRFAPYAILPAAMVIAPYLDRQLRNGRFGWLVFAWLVLGLTANWLGEWLMAALKWREWPVEHYWPWAATLLALAVLPLLRQLPGPGARLRGGSSNGSVALLGLVMSLGILAVPAPHLWDHYSPRNPALSESGLGARMVMLSRMPVQLCDFVNDNQIAGPTYNEWRWEGYLQWHCPGLKVFVGGRAQQVYEPGLYGLYNRLKKATSSDQLERWGIRFIALDGRQTKLLKLLRSDLSEAWPPLYTDGQVWLFAHRHAAENQPLIEALQAGKLVYRDPGVALASRAAFHHATGSVPAAVTFSEIKRANAIKPLPDAYLLVGHMASKYQIGRREALDYLEQEYQRLEQMDFLRPGGGLIIDSRHLIAQLLASLHGGSRDEQTRELWRQRAAQAGDIWDQVPTGPVAVRK